MICRLPLLIALFIPASFHGALGLGWTEGKKKLLYVRVDFPDLPGDLAPEADVRKVLDQFEAFYGDNSFDKLQIHSTITPTIRLPKPQTGYDSDRGQIGIDARAAGFDTAKYDFDVFLFRTHKRETNNFGAIGAKGLHIGNSPHFGAIAHEFGHNLGLVHTRHWHTTDGTVFGKGEWYDYGDLYDMMGCGSDDPRSHLSAPFKNQLGWLDAGGIINTAPQPGSPRGERQCRHHEQRRLVHDHRRAPRRPDAHRPQARPRV